MIRVLQCVNDMHRAGLETMLMNYYRNIDRTKIQFDFLTHRPHRSDYDDEIESLGGKVYYAPRLYPQNYPTYFKWMSKFFAEHPEYKIVHSHIDSMSYLPLLAAKKAGVPVRIAHSHNTSIDKDFKYPLKQYFRFRINSVCNHRLACGQEAGRFLFGNRNFEVIPNAIDAKEFYFDESIRDKKRKELNISDKYVIGHVGRFAQQKNHEFLIRTFAECIKIQTNLVLLLVGEGKKKDEIKKLVQTTGLEGNVLFLENRSDVNELYQAMDVFVMPSLFEGLPVVGIEAQFSGLPCVFSDRVTDEVKLIDDCKFISLNQSTSDWAKAILEKRQSKRSISNDLIESKYDIRNSCSNLATFYLEVALNN